MKAQTNRLTFSQQFFIATMLFGLFFGAGIRNSFALKGLRFSLCLEVAALFLSIFIPLCTPSSVLRTLKHAHEEIPHKSLNVSLD